MLARLNLTRTFTIAALCAILALALVGAVKWLTPDASAATIEVTVEGDGPPGPCDLSGCTLREAIILANTTPGHDTINLRNKTYVLNQFGADNTAVAGDLDITDDLTIVGLGTDISIIDANNVDRVFHVAPNVELISVEFRNFAIQDGYVLPGGSGANIFNNANLTLNNIVVQRGDAVEGAGIYNTDDLVINDSLITDNHASFGGGILSNDAVTLNDTIVSDNTATQSGGGLRNEGGFANIFDSTITGNTADVRGGGIDNLDNADVTRSVVSDNTAPTGAGIYNGDDLDVLESTIELNDAEDGGGIFNDASVDIDRSTISQNTAIDGGGIYNDDASLSMLNSTISGNLATDDGGGLYNDSNSAGLTHVTIANNTADSDDDSSGDGGGVFDATNTVDFLLVLLAENIDLGGEAPDCSGTIDLSDHNLIGDTTGCNLTGDLAASYLNVPPEIGALQFHGGLTRTHRLLPNSLAIDVESPFCPPPFVDQRNFVRPVDGNQNDIATCDIGSYEFNSFPVIPTPAPTAPPTATPTPGPETPTPTPSPSPTPEPTATPTPTPTQPPIAHGDVQCDGDVDAVDMLAILTFIAGFPPIEQTEPCPDIGTPYGGNTFGDVLCNNNVDSIDALAVGRNIAGLSPIASEPGCPDIGELV